MTLESTEAVISELGGVSAVAELTGAKYQAAWQWKRANAFPPKTYLAIKGALQQRGKDAPASLWGMREAPEHMA